jgi:hypothetical protein
LWALRVSAAHPVSGIASFFSFPGAGFGGYLALGEGLRGTGRLRPLLARMEEQMLRDFVNARGWYIECATEDVADLFARMGFCEVALAYRPPPLDAESEVPLDQAPVILLMYKQFGRRFTEPSLTRADLLSAMSVIFRVVYHIEEPAMSPWLQDIERQTAAWPAGTVQFRRRDQALPRQRNR